MTDERNDLTDAIARAIKLTDDDIRELVRDMADLRAELRGIKEKVQELNQVVIKGNGRESLVATITRTDERLQHLTRSFETYRDSVAEQSGKASQEVAIAPPKSSADGIAAAINARKDVIIALVSGLVAIASIAIPLMLSADRNTPPPLTNTSPTEIVP